MGTIIAIGIGGFFGAIGRYLIASFVQKMVGPAFPLGTLAVNVLGSFLIGFLFAYFENTISPTAKAMLVTGFLGALTTFSTFSLETLLLLQNGEAFKSLLNIVLNVFLSLTATWLGIILFKKLYGGL